jgi:acetyl esterase/lipase
MSRMLCVAIIAAAASAPAACSDTFAQTNQRDNGAVTATLLFNSQSTLGELLEHPSLDGFAERTLPWYGRTYDRDLTLKRIGSLLPYHSDVDSDAVLSGLNLLIENAERGVPVFHEIYTEEEKLRDPDLRATGLFFFPGRPGAPFAIIASGGGFSYVASVHEGFPYAADISNQGYNAFVLTYRTVGGAVLATADMARAIDYVMARADDLAVARERYSVWGSSAGARMAACIGSHGTAAFGGQNHPRASTVVMAYTSHSDLSRQEPATFVVVGGRDGIAPSSAMVRRVSALRASGVDVEYKVYPNLAHGFGAGVGTEAEGWIREAVGFWARQRR